MIMRLTANQGTSFKLTIDEGQIAYNGSVGNSRDTSDPEYSHRLVYFTPMDDEINIVLHVSNYNQVTFL